MSARSGLDHRAGQAWPEARSTRRGDGARFGDVEAMEVPDSGAVW